MKIDNPNELVGKLVYDASGNPIGSIDKTWTSWNQEYPGQFFGIKPNENTRCNYFRGTYKLVPVFSEFIREIREHVTLNRTLDELSRLWNRTILCGPTTHPTDRLVDMPVYDRTHSRIGTINTVVESGGTLKDYGCILDPYLCQRWNIPYNKLMPIPIQYISQVADTITLDRTLDELKEYWKQHQQFF